MSSLLQLIIITGGVKQLNKKLKKILSLFLALAITVVSLPVNGLPQFDFADFFSVIADASGEFEDDELDSGNDEYHPLDNNYIYEIINDKEAIIIEHRYLESDKIDIPSSVDGYSVIGIGDNVFYGEDSVAEVIIPDSIVSIGAGAFAYCSNLVSVTMGSGVTDIGEGAFEYCESLSNVEFGENVAVLSASAFSNCTALEAIEIPRDVTVVGDGCFENCINLSDLKFNESLQVIGNRAFRSCVSLEEIVIPDSVTEIGDYAFQNCESVMTVDFGNSLISIGDAAVTLCDSLEEIIIPDSVETLGNTAFARNIKLKSVTIGKSVLAMGELIFSGCPMLSEIIVDENNPNYSSVNSVLFNKSKTELIHYPHGKNETEYIIPDGVVTISYGAFYGYEMLNKIIIPDTVTCIETGAFYDCIALSEIDISENLSVIGRYAFLNTGYYNDSANWEDGVLYLENNLIAGNQEVPEIYIVKDGTKTVADYAMEYCGKLTSLTISDEVENIGAYAFIGCESLENIKISSNIKNIGECAFKNTKCCNDSRRWVNNGFYIDNVLIEADKDISGRFLIESGTTFIADRAFSLCENLEEIIIPETVTVISENAFEGLGNAVVYCIPDSFAAEYCVANNINCIISSYEALKLDTSNVKTEYTVGDSLNTDGMNVYAVYSGGIEMLIPLSDVTFSTTEFKRAGQFRITVSYNGKSSYYTVTVSEPVLKSVEIKSMPNKTDYILGENADTTGLILTAFYSNSTQKEITEGFEVSASLDEPGERTVTVLYTENGVTVSTEYTVTVSEGHIAVVSGENMSVLPGETVSVSVKISNNSGFMGFAINIAYDDSVFTPVSVTGGEILANGALNDSIGGIIESGNLKVVFSSTENIVADGLLFTVEFKADKLAAAQVGTFDVSYLAADTFDEEWNDVKLACKDFSIEIQGSQTSVPMFYSEDTEGKSGLNITVPVMLGNNNGMTSFDIALSYDSEILTPLSVSAGEVISGEIDSNCSDASGKLNLSWNGAAVENDGAVAYVVFGISEDAVGSTEITISGSDGFNALGDAFSITISKPGMGTTAELYSSQISVLPGQTVEIPLYIANNLGIMGFGLIVSYDSAKLTPVSVKKGDLLTAGTLENNIGNTDGSYKIIWNHSSDVAGDGLLLTLSFEAAEDIEVQNIPISIEYIQADTYNEAWEIVEFETNEITVLVDSLVIKSSSSEIHTGETVQLSAEYNYSQDACSVIWTTDNADVADVDENGKVTVYSLGSATITAVTADGNYSASYEINTVPRKLTVEWIVDGKSSVQTVIEGEAIAEPDAPEKHGYTFSGWTPEVPKTMPEYNLTFTAVWTADTYSIQYDANGGNNAPSAQTKIHDENLVLSDSVPTKSYLIKFNANGGKSSLSSKRLYLNFESWNTEINGSGTTYSSGGTYTENSSVVLYAQWSSAPEYMLPFAQKEGYTFIGWNTSLNGNGTNYEAGSYFLTEADVTLYAQWEINTYSVMFDANGGINPPESQTKEYGKDLTVGSAIPEKTGYTFVAWNTKADGSGMSYAPGSVYSNDTDVTLYAQWSANSYPAVFDANGGAWSDNLTVKTVNVEFDKEIAEPQSPIKEGYVFCGWSYDGENICDSLGVMDSTDGKSFKAVWIPSDSTRYTVETYVMNTAGEYVMSYQIYTGVTEKTVSVAPEIAEGFELNSESSILEGVILADSSLVLKVYIDRKTYSLTTVVDGVSSTTDYLYEETVSKPEVPFKTGYTFDSWSDAIPETMPAENITVTAKWTANIYNAVFKANGGFWADMSTKKTVKTAFDSKIIAPESPSREGYVFAGWLIDGENVGTDAGIMDDVNGKNFEAAWIVDTDADYIVETYMMNTSGEYEKSTQKFSGSKGKTVTAEYTVSTGFSLNSQKSILEGTIAADNSLVLKVYIDRNTYKFTAVVDGVSTSSAYLYGSLISEPVTPSKSGYKFVKWSGSIPETMPAKNVTVTAVFEKFYVCPDCGNEILGEDNINAHIAAEARMKATVKIKNNSGSKTISYGETLRLTAITSNMPADAKIYWYVDGAKKGEGETFNLSFESGTKTVEVKLVDAKGNIIKNSSGNEIADSESVTINSGFFQKLISFFKNLFGINRTVVQVFKTVY